MSFGDVIRAMGGGDGRPAVPVRARVRTPPVASPPIPVPPPITAPAPPPVTPRSTITAGKPVLDPRHVTKLVAKSDAEPQMSRSGGNADNYLHVSSLIGCCERQHCISQQHGLPTATSVSGPMRLIWAIGRAVEKHIRNGVIKAREFHGIFGVWRCPCEAVRYTGEHVAGRICNRCTHEANTYEEPKLTNDFARTVGSPDLTLIEQGWYMPVEIKSMNKEQFDELTAPLADHCIQVCSYIWMYEQMGFPVLDIAPVIYGRKDFKFGGSFASYKEYHVRYADWRRQVESLMDVSRRIDAHNQMRTLPTRTVCSSPTSRQAKECPRAALCFNLD